MTKTRHFSATAATIFCQRGVRPPFYALLALLGIGCVSTFEPEITESEVHERIDRELITAALAPVLEGALACGADAMSPGMVRVHISVAPDGRITKTRTVSAPSPELGECVARALGSATFAPTRLGGSFTYPVLF